MRQNGNGPQKKAVVSLRFGNVAVVFVPVNNWIKPWRLKEGNKKPSRNVNKLCTAVFWSQKSLPFVFVNERRKKYGRSCFFERTPFRCSRYFSLNVVVVKRWNRTYFLETNDGPCFHIVYIRTNTVTGRTKRPRRLLRDNLFLTIIYVWFRVNLVVSNTSPIEKSPVCVLVIGQHPYGLRWLNK